MSHLCFRVLSERYLTSEIDILRWNPKYDLLAIATKRGDVILQRLFWKKAWQVSSKSISSGGNTAIVSSLSWSPNGKHLAIVYSNGKIVFVETETGRVVYHIDGHFANDAISRWVELKDDNDKTTPVSSRNSSCIDDVDDLLLPLPPTDKSKATSSVTSIGEPLSFISDSHIGKSLSLFTVGDTSGKIRLFLNGFFHLADMDLRKCLASNTDSIPIAFDLTPNLDRLAAAVCQSAGSETTLLFAISKTPLSSGPSERWIRLSKRVSYVSSALRYTESAMQKISDSWEDAVTDLDNKLTKYALTKGNSSHTIGDDFLRMLVFGAASPELEVFLTKTLSDKGIKKLSGSIENSYQTLLNLLGVNLDCAASALYHHLTTLQNLMADDHDTVWTECIETVASLSLKITRLYDIAERNVRSIGLFVRWLQRCVLSLSDENLPSSLSHFSDEDIDAVASFIQDNFCKPAPVGDSDSPSAMFGLAKLGSCLKPDSEAAVETSLGTGSTVYIAHRPMDNVSLADCVKMVRQCIAKVQDRLSTIFSCRFALVGSAIPVFTTATSSTSQRLAEKVVLLHDSGKRCFRLICAAENENGHLFVTEFNDQTAALMASWKLFSPAGLVRNVVALDPYNTTTVTALIREREGGEGDWKYVLYQIDSSSLRVPSSPVKMAGGQRSSEPIRVPWDAMKTQALSDGQFRLISVSGSRKVGCIVFACRTRLKLLEMEPEDDTTAEGSSLSENQSSAMDVEN